MPNAKDAELDAFQRILIVGPTGSGKTSQFWTLPGRKFVYIFDPNALATLKGCDIDYELFMPDVQDVDMTLKGFNKDPKTGKTYKSDKPKTPKEPDLFNRWGDDFNDRYDRGFFTDYQWLGFDSMTFFAKSIMDRQLFINGRYGDIEELGDYRIVGSKIADIFNSINAMNINIFATGHLQTFQDDKTKKIQTQIYLPGKARNMLPLQFSNVWLSYVSPNRDDKKGTRYAIRTVPEDRTSGLQDIRSAVQNLSPEEDMTIEDFTRPTQYGVGRLLTKPATLRKAS